MRIHRLQLVAYGPFPGEIQIDFDELNDAGIFLLNGPTGSGKSSILDAVCFALYGDTSLNRPDLKSHFAADTTAPLVTLECTINQQRLRIERSPKWERPKKRGSGTTTEPAKVLIQRQDRYDELSWETVAERNDEAGIFIKDLLGLTREQFTQVMLLPQGKFARFLKANSYQREDLLKKLFPLSTFEKIQAELHQQSSVAQKIAQDAEQQLTQLQNQTHRTIQRAQLDRFTEHEPTEADRAESTAQEATGQNEQENTQDFLTALNRTLNQIEQILNQQQQQSTELDQQLSHLRNEHHRLSTLRTDWLEFDKLTAFHQQLQHDIPAYHADQERRDAAQAAQTVVPAFSAQQRAKKKARQTQERYTQHLNKLCAEITANLWTLTGTSTHQLSVIEELPRTPAEKITSHSLEHALEVLRDLQERHRHWITLEQELRDLHHQKTQLHTQQTQHATATTQLREKLEKIRTERHDVEHSLAEHADVAVELLTAEHQLSQAQHLLALSQQLAERRQQLSHATSVTQKAEQRRQELSEHAESLQRTRFSQAAFLLASELEDHTPCPVCGATEHPQPATPSAHSQPVITEKDVSQAIADRNTAEKVAQQRALELKTINADIKNLEEQGALPTEQAQTRYTEIQRQRSTLLEQKKTHEALNKKNLLLQQQDKKHTEKLHLQEQQHTALNASLEGLHLRLTELENELNRAKLAENHTHEQAAHTLQTLSTRFKEAITNAQQAHTAEEQTHSFTAEAQRLLKESAFTSEQAATEAFLPKEQLHALEQRIEKFSQNLSGTAAQLQREAMQRIGNLKETGHTIPTAETLTTLSGQIQHIAKERDTTFATVNNLAQVCQEISELSEEYRKEATTSQQLLTEARMKKALADVAAGLSSENKLAMSLTTYVLAAQLEEVTQSSTLHLEKMTHGRYRLDYTEEKQGSGKSGLNIAVFDSWHGLHRLPSTLSGGETFMASLALALGLADVVQQHNGGIDIDTLFVDEGFGTLDDSTLEIVMDTLDSLREGGRVVGLISHVAEMKNRIPLHITLTTSPEGSRID